MQPDGLHCLWSWEHNPWCLPTWKTQNGANEPTSDPMQCVCLTIFISHSPSNPKCHVTFTKTKTNVNCHLQCLSKCHLNVTCLLVRVISISKVSINMWLFFLHKSHYMSEYELWVSIDMQLIYVQVFACQMLETCNFFVKIIH